MLDPSALWRAGSAGTHAPPGAPGVPRDSLPGPHGTYPASGPPAPPDTQERWDESPQQRNARIRQLAQLVKSGGYAVQSHRLAQALLEWDPHRGNAKQSVEVADRRRAYMREYMRRRRAQTSPDAGETVPALQASQGPPSETGLSPGLWQSG